jgi:hypothetical protein
MSEPIKATLIKWEQPPLYLVDSRWHGPRGAFVDSTKMDGENWILCCPGCGELGGPRQGAKWEIVSGSFSDVSKLTIRPSLQMGSCCGWHGYLTDGEFKTC